MCLCVCDLFGSPCRPEEGIRSPGAEIAADGKPQDVGAELASSVGALQSLNHWASLSSPFKPFFLSPLQVPCMDTNLPWATYVQAF